MLKKVCFVQVLFLFLLLSLCGFQANATVWTDGTGDHLWNTGGNWDTSSVPSGSDDAVVNIAGSGAAAVVASAPPAFDQIKFNRGVINIVSGGALTANNRSYLGYGLSWAIGTVAVSGTGSLTVNHRAILGSSSQGGYLTLEDDAQVYVSRTLEVEAGGVQILGGTLDCAGFWLHGTSTMHIYGGTFKIRTVYGDDTIESYITSGQLTGGREITITEDAAANCTYVTSLPFELAWNPVPVNMSSFRPCAVNLSWSEGSCVGSSNKHDVYFGDDQDEVSDANTSTPDIYKGRQDANNFSAGELDLGTYYWRIDEVNETTSDLWNGQVWSFTVTGMLDDMEDYNSATIGDTWVTNSTIDVETDEYLVRGVQSMKLDYPATVTRTFDQPASFVLGGTEILGVYFQALEGSDSGIMSVKLTDADGDISPTVSYDDPNALDIWKTGYGWQRLLIDLEDFNTATFDIDEVNSIEISVTSNGSGTIFIDSVELLPVGCYGDRLPAGDCTGDCVIDVNDLEMLVGYWLAAQSSHTVTATPPNDERIVVQYSFEDSTSGCLITDSSGNGKDGELYFDGDYSFDEMMVASAGYDGSNCIALCDSTYTKMYKVTCPGTIFSTVGDTNEVTISAWIKLNDDAARPYGGQIWLLYVESAWAGSLYAPSTNGDSIAGRITGDTSFYWDNPLPTDFKGSWNHYAAVKNTDTGVNALYHNGQLVVQIEDFVSLDGISDFFLGNYKFKGLMDEVRVYDYALSQEEIVSLAGQSQIEQPESFSSFDPFEDGKIDFKDFAILAGNWNNEVLWP